MKKRRDKTVKCSGISALVKGPVERERARLEAALQQERELQIVHDLQAKLGSLAPSNSILTTWDRGLAIRVLEIVGDAVGEIMDRPISDTDTELRVFVEHGSTTVIKELVVVLRDLEKGIVAPPLNVGSKSNLHSTLQNRTKAELLRCVQLRGERLKAEGVKEYVERARRDVAKAAKETGITWAEGRTGRRTSITAEQLDSWSRPSKG